MKKCDFYLGAHNVDKKETKNNIRIEDAIRHFQYGISHDIYSEPVTTYAKLAVQALEKQLEEKEQKYEECK